MSDQAILIQAFEHAVTMAHDVTRPLYESLQWAAKAEAYAFALCQHSQDLTGPGGLAFWHEQTLSAYRLGQQQMAELHKRAQANG